MLNEREEEYQKALSFRERVDEPIPAYEQISKELGINFEKLKKHTHFKDLQCLGIIIGIVLLLTVYPSKEQAPDLAIARGAVHVLFIVILYYWCKRNAIKKISMDLYDLWRLRKPCHSYDARIAPEDKERAWRILRREYDPITDSEKALVSCSRVKWISLIAAIACLLIAHALAYFTDWGLPIIWALVAYAVALLISIDAYGKSFSHLQQVLTDTSDVSKMHAYIYMHSEEFYLAVMDALVNSNDTMYRGQYADFLSDIEKTK